MTQEIQTERMPKAMCVSLHAGHGEEFFERALPIGNGGLKPYLTGGGNHVLVLVRPRGLPPLALGSQPWCRFLQSP